MMCQSSFATKTQQIFLCIGVLERKIDCPQCLEAGFLDFGNGNAVPTRIVEVLVVTARGYKRTAHHEPDETSFSAMEPTQTASCSSRM